MNEQELNRIRKWVNRITDLLINEPDGLYASNILKQMSAISTEQFEDVLQRMEANEPPMIVRTKSKRDADIITLNPEVKKLLLQYWAMR